MTGWLCHRPDCRIHISDKQTRNEIVHEKGGAGTESEHSFESSVACVVQIRAIGRGRLLSFCWILTRVVLRLQSVRDRSGMSYLSHQMTGTATTLRRLGFRPRTANRGPGGDLAKILATDTTVLDSDRLPDAAPANRCCLAAPTL